MLIYLYIKERKVYMKTFKISDELHSFLKKYCKDNNLKMGRWVESIVEDYLLKNNIGYDNYRKSRSINE